MSRSYVPTREVYTIVNEEYNQKQVALLNENELKLLNELSERLASDFPNDVKDKVALVRFLKARKWKLDKAESMFRNRMKWVQEYQPHKITEEDIKSVTDAGKAFFYGRDKLGRPILVIRAAKHRTNEGKHARELFFKYFVYLSELGQLLAPPPPHNQYLILYDRTDCSQKNFDTKAHIRMVSLGDYYPEMVGMACILYPNFLYYMLYNVAKAFIDPVTLSKIKVFSSNENEMTKQLEEIVGSRSQMLPDMGGNSNLPWYPQNVPDTHTTKFQPKQARNFDEDDNDIQQQQQQQGTDLVVEDDLD
jgi:hypothetical protein